MSDHLLDNVTNQSYSFITKHTLFELGSLGKDRFLFNRNIGLRYFYLVRTDVFYSSPKKILKGYVRYDK